MHPEAALTNNIWSAAILVVGSIITTLLTVKYKDRIQQRLIAKKPKDRLDIIFDGYERLIADLHNDINDARLTNTDQRKQLLKMELRVSELESELALSKQQIELLTSRIKKYEPGFEDV